MNDVIIVGAGPAGSITALLCAKAGLQVLLIDKQPFPREKTCAGALSVRAQAALQFAGITLPPEIEERQISGIQFIGPDMLSFTVRTPTPFACTIRRSNFDHFLAQQAIKTGVQFLDDCSLTKLVQNSNQVVCHTTKGVFKGQLLIGADGAASTVGKITGLRHPMKPNEIGLAIEVNVPVPNDLWKRVLDSSIIYAWFLSIPSGYFWVFPRKESLSVGLGGVANKLGNAPNLLRGLSRRFTNRLGIAPFSLSGIRGHMLPFFKNAVPLTANRVLLVGDAAGFIDAFSGQGICYALESGLIAANTCIRLITMKLDISRELLRYQTLIQRRLGAELHISWSISKFIHSHLYGGFRLARRLRAASRLVFDLASGKTDYNRMKSNPLAFISQLIINELQSRVIPRS